MHGADADLGGDGGAGPECHKTIQHGARCSCRLLAEALRVDPKELSYEYCCSVVQRHWRMTCRHGETMPSAAAPNPLEKWKDLGEITPLNAVLVQNA
jgi:hypothetical protein